MSLSKTTISISPKLRKNNQRLNNPRYTRPSYTGMLKGIAASLPPIPIMPGMSKELALLHLQKRAYGPMKKWELTCWGKKFVSTFWGIAHASNLDREDMSKVIRMYSKANGLTNKETNGIIARLVGSFVKEKGRQGAVLNFVTYAGMQDLAGQVRKSKLKNKGRYAKTVKQGIFNYLSYCHENGIDSAPISGAQISGILDKIPGGGMGHRILMDGVAEGLWECTHKGKPDPHGRDANCYRLSSKVSVKS